MGPKKKKITKKERQRLAEEHEKIKKIEMEQKRLKLLKEEKERIERDKKFAQEKIKREIVEQEIRCKQLATSCGVFKDLNDSKLQLEKTRRQEDEWTQYLKCDGLPDPNSFSQMNTYLYLWQKEETPQDIEKVVKKTDEVLNLLSSLDELIFDPPCNATLDHVEEWKKIRNAMRCEQQKRLDVAAYKLLRNIKENFEAIDMTTSKYTLESRHFILNLWNFATLPISVSGANEIRQSFNLDFPNIGVSMLLPARFAGINLAVRALWLKYDHISDGCRTWECLSVPDAFAKDLNDVMKEEWRIKNEFQRHLDEFEENIENATAEELMVNKSKKTVADSLAEMDENQIAQWKEKLTMESAPHEVNLRKFTFLGGVFYLDLLEPPSQRRELNGNKIVTILDTPEGLNRIPYYEHYVPQPPPEPGAIRTPEEIEIEIKKQEKALEKLPAVTVAEEPEKSKMPAEDLKREMEKEKELQKLVVLTVDLPENVLWFEQPMAANWDPNNNYWSTEEIHDLKFNEDKQTVTFRTGRMGLVGLACYRYCNFPYQTWEMKPESTNNEDAGVLLNITAAVAIIEFLIKGGKVSLNSLQNGATNALQEHVGVFYKPKKLIRILQNGGVDIFPPPDAFCYLEGTVKHRVAEDHLYHCMGVMSTSHNFSWSRWNALAGRRNMVLQMMESTDKRRSTNNNILHVTPLKAILVDCTEVSASFNENGIEGMEFYSDLYSLAMNYGSEQAKRKIQQISFELAETVSEMLCASRPLCFS